MEDKRIWIPYAKDLTQYKNKLEIPEIRVWCHPRNGGDDFYYTFESFQKAMKFIKRAEKIKSYRAETIPLIAFRGLEINIFSEDIKSCQD